MPGRSRRTRRARSSSRGTPPRWRQPRYWGEFLIRPPRGQDVDRWVQSMASDPAHLCVVHNIFRREARGFNLPKRKLSAFLATLGRALAKDARLIGRDALAIQHVADAAPGKHYVAGKRRPREVTACRRVMSVEKFSEIFLAGDPIFRSESRTTKDVKDMVENGQLRGRLRGRPLRADPKWRARPEGRRPWWVAPRDDVPGLSAEAIRSMLGLSHFPRSAFVVIDYPPEFMEHNHLAAPTVLDAQGAALFRVCMPPRPDDGWGRSVALHTFRDGAREAVHGPLDELTEQFRLSTTGYLQASPTMPKYAVLYRRTCRQA
jgi:hypothetical protein